jgi:hypothetical protein
LCSTFFDYTNNIILQIHINSLDYHLRRHELAGDDLKHKQDQEYEKSVEEEVKKRTEKEAEEREAERAKMKAQEDAEFSEIIKQSSEGNHISFCSTFRFLYC